MSTYRDILEEGKQKLMEKQIPNAQLDAWLLLEYLTGKGRSWYYLHMEEPAEESLCYNYKMLVTSRGKHIPLQQLTGEAHFMGLKFKVNEHVLIPRQDTEILVLEALKRLEKGQKVLDMCTGSGCILISLLYNSRRVLGSGVDISPEALDVARENRDNMGIDKCEFVLGDLFEAVEDTYHMIVSNPPYIPQRVIPELMEEVRDYEPHIALDGGEDGLDYYRRIVVQAGDYLYEKGWLLMEIGADQSFQVVDMFAQCDYDDIEVIKDLSGLDRVVIGRKK